MLTKKIKIENDNTIYFIVELKLTTLIISIYSAKTMEKILLMKKEFHIQKDIFDTDNSDVIHIKKEDVNIPELIYDMYKEYLEKLTIEDELSNQIKDAKYLEFGELQEGEEDYLP